MNNIKYIMLALVLCMVCSCGIIEPSTDVVLIAKSKGLIRERLKQEEPQLSRFIPTLFATDTLAFEPVSRGNGRYEVGTWKFDVNGPHLECVYRYLYGGEGRFEIHELRVEIEAKSNPTEIRVWAPKHIQGGKG
jgi:hypothetical protein